MTITQKAIGDVTVLSVMGDITITGSGTTPLSDAVRDVLARGRNRLVLDLAHVKYMDSAGLGELVQALTAARNRGGTLKLLHVTRRLNDLLVMTKLLTVFDCYDEEAAAVASFAPPPLQV
jgi:anti-sigma B factor antagonist